MDAPSIPVITDPDRLRSALINVVANASHAVAEASARLTAESLTKRSPIIKQLVEARQLRIAAAMHDITTGKVTWLDNVPKP